MKKLLSILGTIILTGTATTSIISCKAKNVDVIDYDNNNLQTDMATMFNIVTKVSNNINQYGNSANLRDSKLQPQFDSFYDEATAENSKIEISDSIEKYKDGIVIITNGFKSIFDNINLKIKNEYSNFYPNSEPLTWQKDRDKFFLNYVNLDEIKKITSDDITNVKAAQLEYSFVLKLSYKNLEQDIPFTLSFLISNDPKKIDNLLKGVIQKISQILNNFFKNYTSVIVDKNSDFRSIYDNFQVNYTRDSMQLENIFVRNLRNAIRDDLTIENNVK